MATKRPRRAKRTAKPKAKATAAAKPAPAGVRYPGESRAYRAARQKLLQAERDLRRRVESVAALRRKLPLGGAVPEDYVFETPGPSGPRAVRLSELFVRAQASLVVYSFMYGPEMERACPSCTSILDALDGTVQHALQRVNFAVVAKSPLPRIAAFARERGWRNLPLLSSAKNGYNRAYHAESETGSQLPVLNVFVRRGDRVHHTFGTELLFHPAVSSQNHRHVDMIWPLWNLFDYTPDGRGTDWYTKLSYAP